jgi:hypothetical protein
MFFSRQFLGSNVNVIKACGCMRTVIDVFTSFPAPYSIPRIIHQNYQRERSPSYITSKKLRLLYLFNNLENVKFNIGHIIEMDDGVLREISSSWSKLKVLSLEERAMNSEPHTTFPGIVSLIKSCPLLEHLSLRFDGYSIESLTQISCTTLQSLDICTSPTGPTSHNVGEIFAKLFPKIRYRTATRGSEILVWY